MPGLFICVVTILGAISCRGCVCLDPGYLRRACDSGMRGGAPRRPDGAGGEVYAPSPRCIPRMNAIWPRCWLSSTMMWPKIHALVVVP